MTAQIFKRHLLAILFTLALLTVITLATRSTAMAQGRYGYPGWQERQRSQEMRERNHWRRVARLRKELREQRIREQIRREARLRAMLREQRIRKDLRREAASATGVSAGSQMRVCAKASATSAAIAVGMIALGVVSKQGENHLSFFWEPFPCVRVHSV